MMKYLPDGLKPHALPEPAQRRTKKQVFVGLLAYLPDWILTICLAAVFAGINQVTGFRREFSMTDTSLQHTYAVSERVPVWLLVVLVILVPLGIFAVVSLIFNRNVWDLHSACLGLILAEAITWVVTESTKLCVGRPRPDLLDRCQPVDGAENAPVYGLVTSTICTQTDDHILKDGFKSFPSGHSSSAFAGLVFLSLYLAGKFHLFESKNGRTGPAWLAAGPLLGAALIAISRSMDYRHHATDILAGSILGSVVATLCYCIYFPPLTHPTCHLPYSHRLWSVDPDRPTSDPEASASQESWLLGQTHSGTSSESTRSRPMRMPENQIPL